MLKLSECQQDIVSATGLINFNFNILSMFVNKNLL